MTRRRRRLLIGLAVLALTAAGYHWFFGGWTVGRVERLIQIEVRPGCTRQEVEAWMASHGFGPTDFADADGGYLGSHSFRELAGLPPGSVSGVVGGEIHPANVDPLWRGSIIVFFFIDNNGRLAGHYVHPFVMAP